MKTCSEYTTKLPILAAALLHDVLEDTPTTAEEIRQYLLTLMSDADADKTLALVTDLTDVYTKQAYPKLNRRSRKNKENERLKDTSPDSQTIKYADIIDNCNEIVVQDPDFAKVFLYECRTNLKVIGKGNPELYRRATDTVNKAIGDIRKT